jgi:SAM-dependent methyltransferase
MSFDYSIHYRRFHDGSADDIERMKEWLVAFLRDDLPSDRSVPVLDIGCGVGFALHALRTMDFENIRGIETSAEQADIARSAGFTVDVVEDTAGFLADNPQTFGTILLMDVLEHIPILEQIPTIRMIRRALRPDGRVIITVPNANATLASRWRYIDFTHHCSFTEHSLYFVLRNAGFCDVRMDNHKGIGRFPSQWWKRSERRALRKWLTRFAWLQVFKAELPDGETLDDVCFELNLKAIAFNSGVPSALAT